MPVGNWNLQWLNHNSQRSYPLTDRASKTDTTGTLTIPDSFIVGMYFPIPLNASNEIISAGWQRAYIKRLVSTPQYYAITLAIDDAEVASCSIPRAAHTRNTTYPLYGIHDFYQAVGHITIGLLDEIDALPGGLFEFDGNSGEVEPDVIKPFLQGVSSLRVLNNGVYSDKVYGDVVLVAGENMRIHFETVTIPATPESEEKTEKHVVFSAISGDNLNTPCVCEISDDAPCITSINGVSTNTGNFNLAPNGCVTTTNIANGITIADICAEPCCGCNELDALTNQINRFGDGITTLQNFVTRLGSEVAQMNIIVIGSRIGRSCS